MKLRIWALFLAIVLASSVACHKEDINPADQQDTTQANYVTKEIGPIGSLDITGHGKIYLKKGDKWTITYNTNSSTTYFYDSPADKLYIDKSEDSILITGPNLAEIDIAHIVDASFTAIDPMTCLNLKLELAGSADLNVRIDSITYMVVEAADSSKIVVHGDHNEAIEVNLSGNSIFDGSATLLNTGAEVYMSDNSQATVYTNRIVQGAISGNSILYVKGDAVIDVQTSGNAQVVKISK